MTIRYGTEYCKDCRKNVSREHVFENGNIKLSCNHILPIDDIIYSIKGKI